MDKITKYRNIIKKLLIRHAEIVGNQCNEEMETLLSFDEERDQYLWLQVGWEHHRVHGITLHLRLKDDKIWIEQDWTENGIATHLLEAGVPNEDMVLAFHPPEMRTLTEFAVA
ncbi:conserved hypothetical protein [Beggiatoa sp. PS]|nr:conserved hypothetical protein [Beggiatoa sp. PS]